MIRVRCLGHIATAVGANQVDLDLAEADAASIVDSLRAKAQTPDPGFSRFNTLVMVDDGEAFVPATKSRLVREGQQVVLIPFSHGG